MTTQIFLETEQNRPCITLNGQSLNLDELPPNIAAKLTKTRITDTFGVTRVFTGLDVVDPAHDLQVRGDNGSTVEIVLTGSHRIELYENNSSDPLITIIRRKRSRI